MQQKGELNQGWYVRERILNGCYDFSGLTYGNQWAKELYIYLDSIQKAKMSKKSVSPIRYCKMCISENIHCYGYGYFKKIWSQSHWCRIHKKELYTLISNQKPLWEDIVLILSGFLPINGHIEQRYKYADDNHFKIMAAYGELHIELNNCFSYPYNIRRNCVFNFSPCFQMYFLQWCFFHRTELLNELSHNYDLHDFFNLYCTRPSIFMRYGVEIMKDYAIVLFNLLSYMRGELFVNYIESNAYYIEDGNMLKIKNSSCSMCPNLEWSKACVQSRDILRRRLIEPILRVENEGLLRIGRNYYKIDESDMLAKDTQIDKVYYLAEGHAVCDFSDIIKSNHILNSLTPRYVLLGYHDPDNDIAEQDDNRRVDYPIYCKVKITVLPCDVIPKLLPRID